MKKTIRAYHPLEMAYHKFMLTQVIILIITGLPFFSRSFDFIAYGIGFPLSTFMGNNEPLASGLTVLRIFHWGSGFLLTAASIMFLIAMIIKLKKLNIWPDKWGIDAIFDGIKQMKLHYLDNKPAKFGKMNMGQKATAWIMSIAMLLLMLSGVLLVLKNMDPAMFIRETSLLIRDTHMISFVVLGVVLVMHVFFALLPTNKNAFKAMFQTGEMDEEYVKSHHTYWYEKLNK